MSERLDGVVAVVTGGGSGVGAATVGLLAGAGATVVAAGRRQAPCAALAATLRASGATVHGVTADVADWASVERLESETRRLAGPTDVVVAAAGVVRPAGMTWAIEPGEWAANVQTNLVGAFNTLRAFLPGMIERDQGVLVLVSSVAVKLTTPGWGAYGAAKAGVDHLARVAQAELDGRGSAVRVHVVYPGVVDSPMQQTIRSFSDDEFPSVATFRRMHEKGRLRPAEQPAALIRWLLTPAAADLRGQVADIDDPDLRARVSADLGIAGF